MKSERPDRPDTSETVPDGPLQRALVRETREGRIACAAVFRVAQAQGVPVKEAGRAVQRMRIKISGCQLGCFP